MVAGAISGLVVLPSLREQAEHARGSKLEGSTSPGALHQLLSPTILPC